MRLLDAHPALESKGNGAETDCRKILAAKAVQGPALPLQSVDNIHGCDGLPLGVLGVGHGVADDILKEHLHNRSNITALERKKCTFKTPLVSS